jgi:hypothetical protein
MSLLLSNPNSALNEEEVALLELEPEECFRRAVQRGAIPLDQVTEDLSPRVAAAVRGIITGERLSTPPGDEPSPDLTEEQIRNLDQAQGHPPTAAELERAREFAKMQTAIAQKYLAPYPQFQRLLEAHILNRDEATAAAHAIDLALGRYLTGTKYAAP